MGAEVQEAGVQDALAEKVFEKAGFTDRVYCSKCGSDRVFRVHRRGFMQVTVYPRFGYYPWVCKGCGEHMMLCKRNRARSKHRKTVE